MLGYLMIHSANIYVNQISPGPSMTQKDNWVQVVTSTPCRVQPYRGRPTVDFNVTGKETFARIHFFPPVGMERNNKIKIVAGPSGVGRVWEIEGELVADETGLFSCVFARLYGKGIELPE